LGSTTYEASFISKLTVAMSEAEETRVWVDVAFKCEYMSAELHARLRQRCDQVIGSLVKMMKNPKPWCGPSMLREHPAEYGVSSD
jgi:four helix bundle protein